MNYSQQDFINSYEELLSIVEASTTKWNPRTSNESDPGVVILKLLALLEDKFNYKFDMAEAQNYLDTVSDIQYAQDLFRMLGYVMKSSRSSQGLVGIRLKAQIKSNQLIPKHSIVTNATKTVKFFTLQDVTIPAGMTTSEVKYIQVVAGEPFQITKDGISEFVLKDIDEDGRLPLGRTNLAQNGVFVYTVDRYENGEPVLVKDWEYLDLVLAKPRGTKYYTVSTLESNEAYIQFPKDFETLIGYDGKLVVYGTYTEGSATNIAANTLTQFENSDLNSLFYVSQPTAFENGQDSESIQVATLNYRRQKDLCNTIITSEDFRNAILSLTDPITGKLFSNAIVNTAQDRALKIKGKYGSSTFYDLLLSSTPSYQIDVTPLENSSKYSESFRVRSEPHLGNMITSELASVRSAFSEVVTYNNSNTATNPLNARLLAVTTPKITVRISGYTDAKALSIKQSIKDRLYSRFRADYLTPGVALDYGELVNLIKGVSSSIQYVSVDNLNYKVYKYYKPVDGITSELAIDDEDIRNEIIKRSVLSGKVPLFKYSNRPNTLSKRASMYTSLFANEGNDLEVTVPIPFAVEKEYPIGEKDEDGELIDPNASVNPWITDIQLLAPVLAANAYSVELDEGKKYAPFTMSDNLLFQVRRRQFSDDSVYGSGMSYLFFSEPKCTLKEDETIDSLSTLKATSKIAEGSRITPESNITLTGPNGETIPLTAGTSTTLEQSITLLDGSLTITSGVLKAGSQICPGSTLNGKEFAPTIDADGKDYVLQPSERLVIADSNKNIKESLAAGRVFSTKGIGSLPVSGIREPNTLDFSDNILYATQSITVKLPQHSMIDLSKYKYLLSLTTSGDLTINSDGYMLEEDEFFVYADAAITEYVILGPGTVLKTSSGEEITLTSTPVSSMTDVDDKSKFKSANGIILADSYEITTHTTADKRVLFKKVSSSSHPALLKVENNHYSIESNWTRLGGADEIIIQKRNSTGNWETVERFAGDLYEGRLIGLLVSDEFGVAKLPNGMSLSLEVGNTKQSFSYNTNHSTIIASSIPFKRTLKEGESVRLFSEGITARVTMFYVTNLDTVAQYSIESGADYITLRSNENSPGPYEIPIKRGNLVLANLSASVPTDVTSGPTVTISGKKKVGSEVQSRYICPLGGGNGNDDEIESQPVTNYVNREVTLDLSDLDSVVISLTGDNSSGISIKLSNLSYVEGLSSELITSNMAAELGTMFYVTNLDTVAQYSIESGANYIYLEASGDSSQGIEAGGELVIPIKKSSRTYANLTVELPQSLEFTPLVTIKGATTDEGDFQPVGTLADSNLKIVRMDATNFVDREVTIDLSGLVKIQVSLEKPEGVTGSLAGVVVKLISYVEGLSSELITSNMAAELVFLSKVISDLRTAIAGAEDKTLFNWIDYPTEELYRPLEDSSFFTSSHPFNKNTFPYLELIDSQIKIIGDR